MKEKVEYKKHGGTGDASGVNPFVTLNEDGSFVTRRIPTPSDVRTLFSEFKEMDSDDASRRATLQNIYNGNLPYNPDEMRKLNLANLANFNSGELRGFIDSRVGAISDLALDTVPLVELRPHPAGLAGPQAEEFAEVIAEEFSTTVRDENTLLPTLASMFRECDLFGLGPVTWRSRHDYLPVALRRGQIKFNMRGPIHSKDHELFMFETEMPIHFFRPLFGKPEAAKNEGWNLKAVRDYLIDVFIAEKPTEGEAGDSTATTTIESAMIEMRQRRWIECNQFKSVRVYHSYVKETDGKIRHTISTTQAGVEEWLYDREGAYESMSQCFAWMPASVVEHEAAGSRGVASFMAPIADINNRLLCQMYNIGFRVGTINLVSQSPTAQNNASLIQECGPYSIFPADLTFPQKPPNYSGSQMPQLASLRALGSNIGENNATGVRGTAASLSENISTGAERKTKEQAFQEGQARAQSQQQLFAARVLVLDQIFRETMRRFVNIVKGAGHVRALYPEVKRFIDRCQVRGVTMEALRNMEELFGVYTNRILVTGGGGSHAGILASLLGNFGGGFDEKGRRLAQRDIVKFQLGSKSADRYSPRDTRDSMPTNATSLAVLENGAMQRGSLAVVGSDQFHWSHIPVHMSILQSIVETYRKTEQQPDLIQEPQQMLDVMQAVSKHVQEHLAIGSRQPGMTEKAKVVSSQLASLAPITKGLTMMAGKVERMREAERRRQAEEQEKLRQKAEGNETEIAIHKIDKDAQMTEREQNLMHSIRLKKLDQEREIALKKAERDAIRTTAQDTARMVQGSEAAGRTYDTIDNAPPFPVGDGDETMGDIAAPFPVGDGDETMGDIAAPLFPTE